MFNSYVKLPEGNSISIQSPGCACAQSPPHEVSPRTPCEPSSWPGAAGGPPRRTCAVLCCGKRADSGARVTRVAVEKKVSLWPYGKPIAMETDPISR